MTDTTLWDLCGKDYVIERNPETGNAEVPLEGGKGHIIMHKGVGPMLEVRLRGAVPRNYVRDLQAKCARVTTYKVADETPAIICVQSEAKVFLEACGAQKVKAAAPEPVETPEEAPPAPEEVPEVAADAERAGAAIISEERPKPVVEPEPEPGPEPAAKPKKKRGRPRKVKPVEAVEPDDEVHADKETSDGRKA